MLMYLLLRDNKQSGPFSLDDLKTMGLKAYDLVWVEGKSAAWRYPSELEELKPYAPAVEEQPFDRFFKKPLHAASDTSVPTSNASASNISSASTMVGTVSSPVPGRRFIYVTMPASRNIATAANGSNPTYGSAPRESIKVPIAIPDLRNEEKPADKFEDKSSHPAAIPDRIVEFRPQEKKAAGTPRPVRLLIAAGGVLVLLLTGIFIGLSLNKGWVAALGPAHSDPPARTEKFASVKQTDPAAQQIMQPATSNASISALPDHRSEQKTDSNKIEVGQTLASSGDQNGSSGKAQGETSNKDQIATSNKLTPNDHGNPAIGPKPMIAKRRSLPPPQKALALMPAVTGDSSIIGTSALHREAVHRSDISEKLPDNTLDKDALKNSIANLVFISHNGYNVGAFGGISDLQITVSNRSAYPLDLVVVEVQYIQANKKVYKKENLYFRGIGAGAALMQQAPASSRGIKVQYKVTLVNSKELGLSYSSL
jgi:hypothetical protein